VAHDAPLAGAGKGAPYLVAETLFVSEQLVPPCMIVSELMLNNFVPPEDDVSVNIVKLRAATPPSTVSLHMTGAFRCPRFRSSRLHRPLRCRRRFRTRRGPPATPPERPVSSRPFLLRNIVSGSSSVKPGPRHSGFPRRLMPRLESPWEACNGCRRSGMGSDEEAVGGMPRSRSTLAPH
jgi:hypothetical protein